MADPVTIALMLASTLLSVASAQGERDVARETGKIKVAQAGTQAAQIEAAASQREADRRESLASIVATQQAAAAGAGAMFSGSALQTSIADTAAADRQAQRDALNTSIEAQSVRFGGRLAQTKAKIVGKQARLKQAGSLVRFGSGLDDLR
jgi:hypothetical protein